MSLLPTEDITADKCEFLQVLLMEHPLRAIVKSLLTDSLYCAAVIVMAIEREEFGIDPDGLKENSDRHLE